MTYADDLALAHRLADLADPISMRYFRSDDLGTVTKPDGSPVTLADKEVERVLRDAVATERPGDLVLGEEYGDDGEGPRHWIIDPIDGTTHFVAGKNAWSTLIGLDVEGVVKVGIASAPALGRRWWGAAGQGSWMVSTGEEPTPLNVTKTQTLDESTFAMWPLGSRLNEQQRPVYEALQAATAFMQPTRGEDNSLRDATGNVHGGLMVAEGLLDAYVLLGGGPWDHAAVVPIVEAAGGKFTDLSGGTRVDMNAGLYSNGHVHDELLRTVTEAMAA